MRSSSLGLSRSRGVILSHLRWAIVGVCAATCVTTAVYMYSREGGVREVVATKGARSARITTDELQMWPLVDPSTGSVRVIPRSGSPVLFILVSAADCVSCIEESAQWYWLSVSRPSGLSVVAIMVNSTKDEVLSSRQLFPSALPLYLDGDPWQRIAGRVEGLTPLKVLVDPSGVALLAEVGGSPSSGIAERVSQALNRMDATSTSRR